ncbi:orotidine-5'-phosphate decarboxylase [Corynebacterium heidelbergense]|uniref:Orotidine 5'-phosphate decarboxylase n=1 Tax=Corynebacterium heidelbergense TaxID=2055947 RepID=A0A364VBU8_9CORY|nr:orotidine-5'-phosphate decarboxylase [Corynebacterium heidelbergense]RAV34094.1 orotidine-5'-phosphate decarboxylase [Corynebacterium heidelbergense]WCZ36600.1 orotidine 5'-phosphate decarboxylase [Corynebacterium heidelbergense]
MSAGQHTFGERFTLRAATHGQLCVGMDPHPHLLRAWGLPVSAEGLREFSRRCVEGFGEAACVVKPQVAFYEAFGSVGYAVLEEAIAALRERGVLVIADAKRGDIGSTMAGYATAWLAPESPLSVDALTVSPWLGVDSLTPVFELAQRHHKGAIVLAATSNPEAPSVQRARCAEGDRRLDQDVVDRVGRLNAERTGEGPGNLGVVVGATVQDPPNLDAVGGVILMPGVGAQGGTPQDVRRIAGNALELVSPNVSRAVLKSGPEPQALHAAVLEHTAALALSTGPTA